MDKLLSDLKDRPVEAITLGFVEDAIKLTHSSFIREKIAYNFIKKGWLDLETDQYIKAFKSFNRALKIFNERNDSNGYLLSNHGIATMHNRCCQYEKSLEIFFDILHKLDKRSIDLRFITLKDIAQTYYNWGSYENCINYLKTALEIIKHEKSVFRKVYIYYSLGRAYLKAGLYVKAQEALFMTLTICDANSINYKIGESLTQLGILFRKQQNYTRSESFHIRALQYAKSSRDYKVHIDILLNLGSLCYFKTDYPKGIKFIESALEEIENIKDKYMILVKAYHYLFLLYKDSGDKEEALKYLQKSMVVKEDRKQEICAIQYKLLHIKMHKKTHPLTNKLYDKKRLSENNSDVNYNEMIGLAKMIYSNLSNVLSYSFLSVFILMEDGISLQQITVDGPDKIDTKKIDAKGTPALYVINNNREIVLYERDGSNNSQDFNKNRLTKGMESFMVLPIIRSNNVVGAISIEDKEKNKYTRFDLNTLKTLSAYISLSIENLRIKNEVESLNTLMHNDTVIIESNDLKTNKLQRDRESGFPQLPLFIELLNQSIKCTKREKGKLAIFTIIINLEFDKKDSFLSEDLVISEQTISTRIEKALRAEDLLGKESVDTYIISTKLDSIRGCRAVAEKLVALIKEPIFTENQKIQPLPKIGITIYPDNYLTAEELVIRSGKSANKIKKNDSLGYMFSDPIHNMTGID